MFYTHSSPARPACSLIDLGALARILGHERAAEGFGEDRGVEGERDQCAVCSGWGMGVGRSGLVPIASVEVLNPELPKDLADDKGVMLDVLVQLSDGSQVDVEMQTSCRPGYRQRTLYYWARMYSAQITRGRTYKELAPCAVIFIQNFIELRGVAFHSRFEVLEASTHELFSDALQLHIVELPKFDAGSINDETELARWVQFLSAKSDEEIEALAMADSVMEKAKEALDRISGDPRVRDLAQQREFALDLYSIDLGAAHKEGRIEGRIEGRAEGRAEGESAALLVVLEARGFFLDAEQQQRILQCSDPRQLHEWVRRAATLKDLNELFG